MAVCQRMGLLTGKIEVIFMKRSLFALMQSGQGEQKTRYEADVSSADMGSVDVREKRFVFTLYIHHMDELMDSCFTFLTALKVIAFVTLFLSGGATWFPKPSEEMEVWKCGGFCFE